jgi:transposase
MKSSGIKERRVIRYSIGFKQKVVQEIEQEGLSVSEASRRYGIKGSHTVKQWVLSLGNKHLLNTIIRVEMKGERDRMKELEEEVKKLKLALADAYLDRDVHRTLVDIAKEKYGLDLKKKNAGDASADSGERTA